MLSFVCGKLECHSGVAENNDFAQKTIQKKSMQQIELR